MPTPAEIRARLEANDGTYNHDAKADLAWLLAEHDRLTATLREIEPYCPCKAMSAQPTTFLHTAACPVCAALDPPSTRTGVVKAK